MELKRVFCLCVVDRDHNPSAEKTRTQIKQGETEGEFRKEEKEEKEGKER